MVRLFSLGRLAVLTRIPHIVLWNAGAFIPEYLTLAPFNVMRHFIHGRIDDGLSCLFLKEPSTSRGRADYNSRYRNEQDDISIVTRPAGFDKKGFFLLIQTKS